MPENINEKLAHKNINDSKHYYELPPNCTPLQHQAAGHFFGNGKRGLLQNEQGLVVKSEQTRHKGEEEHSFYKRLFLAKERELNDFEIQLKKLVPFYKGSFVDKESKVTYFKMEHIADGINCPFVVDFKIGKLTYVPEEASLEKIEANILKYPLSRKIGWQISGLRLYDHLNKKFIRHNKLFGRMLDESTAVHGLGLFFQFDGHPQKRAVVEAIRKINDIKEFFEKQTLYHFYSSSIIVVYEGNLENLLNNDKTNQIEVNKLIRVKMVDFAHVISGKNQVDENYLQGLESLISYLGLLLDPEYVFNDVRNLVEDLK